MALRYPANIHYLRRRDLRKIQKRVRVDEIEGNVVEHTLHAREVGVIFIVENLVLKEEVRL